MQLFVETNEIHDFRKYYKNYFQVFRTFLDAMTSNLMKTINLKQAFIDII